ncbi:MAG: methylated-DNA--[protein]-cysteine S-methyltransferase [Candidatus Hydrogenedentes bacterium]|nr:methylated-DNA--[protein]-cysteine S-methyltransferase [Candidatus Hydrogenedentota bacterium]
MTTIATMCYHHARGAILAHFTPRGLCRLTLPVDPQGAAVWVKGGDSPAANDRFCAALTRYFAGEREDFEGVPIDLDGATAFQRQVWAAAREVAWGRTSTYGELAEKLNRKKTSARAVGRALGANPIAIIVPCHRFLAANGDLIGFAAGLQWKRELLELEGSLLS